MDFTQHGEEAYATGEGALLISIGAKAEAELAGELDSDTRR